MRTMHSLILLIYCAILFMAGCQGVPEVVRTDSASEQPPEQEQPMPPASEIIPFVRSHVVGYSVENRPIECIEIGRGEDVILIIASVHGNEWAGTPIARQLSQYLQAFYDLSEGRKILIMPAANPDGMANNTRHNTNGVDLNRNFPAENRVNNAEFGYAEFSEPETRAIDRVIRRHMPDRIISIHQPLTCIDYDGPGAEALARHMAECSVLPVRKLGPRPGSMGSYCGIDMGIPIITLELPQEASQLPPDWLWTFYGKLLVASVIYPEDGCMKKPGTRQLSHPDDRHPGN